jgi:hypothetical protein
MSTTSAHLESMRRHDTRGCERAAFGRDPGRGIEADGIVGLAGVEIAHVVDARSRFGVENVLGEIAVRIDDGDAPPHGCRPSRD